MANERKQITAYLPQDIYQKLEDEAAAEFRSVNSQINVILAERYAEAENDRHVGSLTKLN